MNDLTQRREGISAAFQKHFATLPSLWCRAPGRVDLMGSHTDYNLGYVLTLPIGYDTWVAVHPRQGRTVRLYAANLDAQCQFSLDHLAPNAQQRWCDYVQAVAWVLQAKGFALQGFDGVIQSTLPMSSGLSSSAALECAVATVFEALGGWSLAPIQKALLCQQAENEFVRVTCGILDQYTSCAGQQGCALLLDCRNLSSRPVKLPSGLRVVICDTGFKRELSGSEYGQRRTQCEEGARRLGVKALRELSLADYKAREGELPVEVAKRCRFIVEENDRVLKLAEALEAFDRQAIRRLASASFCGACELYEIGAPAMHSMMQAMIGAPGVIGARQAGAGFGGCMVAFVEASKVDEFTASVRRAYLTSTQLQPEVYAVQAAAGAGQIA